MSGEECGSKGEAGRNGGVQKFKWKTIYIEGSEGVRGDTF